MAEILVLVEKSEYIAQAEALADHLHTKVVREIQDCDIYAQSKLWESNDSGESGDRSRDKSGDRFRDKSEDKSGNETGRIFLRLDENGLCLTDGRLSMQGDLTTMLPRVTKNKWQHEMLVKAAKIKGGKNPIRVFDATAGMGEDSLLLAAAGFEVTLFERDPIIAALLEDSLRRAKDIPELADMVSRMHFREGDSREAMISLSEDERPDVIYLDPMFPARKKSGLIKKKFQLLQQLESPCMDGESLLAAAMQAKPRKIVIKRPAKGPYLADIRPDYSIDGKTIRYDCIMSKQ